MFEIGKKYKLRDIEYTTEYVCKVVYKTSAILEDMKNGSLTHGSDVKNWVEVKPLTLADLKLGEKFRFVYWPYQKYIPEETHSVFIRGAQFSEYTSVISTFSWKVWTNTYLQQEVTRVSE